MKQYILTKEKLGNLPIKKINYTFKIEKTASPEKFTQIIIHHTGNPRTIQQIIDLHVKKNKWTTIGYHFLIGKNGQIYLSRDLKIAGAHTFGYNRVAIGIGLFGNFNKYEPKEKQIQTLHKLVNVLKTKYDIKGVIGHNQATYELLQKKAKKKKISLPNINPIAIESDLNYYHFLKEVNEIIKKSKDLELENLLQRLKSCPGYNLYKEIKKL